MNCPCCNAILPVDRFGQINADELRDMVRRVTERKRYLVLYQQWDSTSAYEQAIKEIFHGEIPIP